MNCVPKNCLTRERKFKMGESPMENSREKGTKMKIFPIYYGQIFPDMTFHDKRIWNGSGIRFDGLT